MDGVTGILAEAAEAGLAVCVDGGKLIVRGPRRHEALARELLARKPEVIAFLSEPLAAERFHHKLPNKIAPRPLTEIYPVPPGDEWLADPFYSMRRRARREA